MIATVSANVSNSSLLDAEVTATVVLQVILVRLKQHAGSSQWSEYAFGYELHEDIANPDNLQRGVANSDSNNE